jgi:hypothetical protein
MKEIITPLGRVVLGMDVNIDISKNNPVFTHAEEFSISLSVPRKPNEHIFGYKYRLSTVEDVVPIDAQFKFFGRDKLNGSLELISVSDNTYEILLKGSRSDFLFKNGKTNLHDLDLGSEYFVSGNQNPSEVQIAAEMLDTLTNEKDWICFPCNLSTEAAQCTNRWLFQENTFDAHNGFFAPYLRLYRAIERLFDYFGYTITTNWFIEENIRRNIVIYSNGFYTSDGLIEIFHLYPRWTIADFISELEDFFPITFWINSRSKTVDILSDDDIVTADPVGSLDAYLLRDYKVIFNEKLSGYELNYNYPEDETVFQDKTYADEIIATEYDSFYDLPEASIIGGTALCLAEGAYYKSVEDGETWVWEKCGFRAISVREGEKEITRETRIYPCINEIIGVTQNVMVLDQGSNPESIAQKMFMQTPVCKGDGGTSGIHWWTDNFRLMVYRGFDAPNLSAWTQYQSPVNTLRYPIANFVNKKMNGDDWPDSPLELRWDGDLGLKGPDFLAFLDGAIKIEAKLVMNHVDLESIDMTKVYTLGGRRVLISELVVHYGLKSRVEVDAVFYSEY